MIRRRRNLLLIAVAVSWACGVGQQSPQPSEAEVPTMPAGMIREFKEECTRLIERQSPIVQSLRVARDGWCYQESELRYGALEGFSGKWARVLYPEAPAGKADPLQAILSFRDELAQHGVELFIMPVPDRPVIYPEGLVDLGRYRDQAPLPNIKPMLSEFMEQVQRAGVSGINLTPYFLKNRRMERGTLFCKSDLHWTPVGAMLAAKIVGTQIKSRPWYPRRVAETGYAGNPYTAAWKMTQHFGHVYERLRDLGGVEDLVAEPLAYREIAGPEIESKTLSGRMRHPEAPIIVLGDSNTPKWNGLYAAFPQELAFEVGLPVDTLSASDGGINESRLNLFREHREHPEYFEGKKALIWVFTIRALLKSRPYWIDIPLESSDPPAGRGQN